MGSKGNFMKHTVTNYHYANKESIDSNQFSTNHENNFKWNYSIKNNLLIGNKSACMCDESCLQCSTHLTKPIIH